MIKNTVKTILNSEVISVKNFQVTTLSVNGVESSRQWTADFRLKSGQRFHVRWNGAGYSYMPDVKHNLLPELKQISWRKYPMGFGGRGAPFTAEVRLADGVSKADKTAYEKILMPLEVNEGRWVPYPRYMYVPMLETALEIGYVWKQQQCAIQKMKMASQNMADALALRKATYDLSQYCRDF